MSSTVQRLTENNTQIHLDQVFEYNSEALYSSADLKRITEWNERVASGAISEPPLSTTREMYLEWYVFGHTRKVSLSKIYCMIQHDLARIKNENPTRMGMYNVSMVYEMFPSIKDKKTIKKYLDLLVEIGLLRISATKVYKKADESLGPVFEALMCDNDQSIDDSNFEGFPDQPSRFVHQPQQPRTLSISTLRRYFWNEHIVGWVLVTTVASWMVKLLVGVAQTGTVTITDLVFAGVGTWLGLIGVFALFIGLLRRRHDGITSLRQYRTS